MSSKQLKKTKSPEQIQADTFMEFLNDGTHGLGPAGVARDDSILFVRSCLSTPGTPVIVNMDADEFMEAYL